MTTNPQHDPHIPDRLGQALQAGFGGYPGVPREVDRAVLDMARAVAVTSNRRHLKHSWRLRLGAVAAVVAGGVTAFFVWPRGGPPTAPTASAPIAQIQPADINADGRVDMLDALLMAVRVEQAKSGPDLNADGKVDQRDVDTIAAASVRLERGSL